MQQELSYGQRLVGLDFNTSGLSDVTAVKTADATIIDQLNELFENSHDEAEIDIIKAAIQVRLQAQMLAVKALTLSK